MPAVLDHLPAVTPRVDRVATRPAPWLVGLMFALFTGAYAAARVMHEPGWATDFDQLWVAARALLDGGNPYAVVGPGREFQWDWPLVYPLPAVLLSLPFTLLPVAVARVTFSTIAGGVLGWAVAPRLKAHWPILLSASYLIATSRTQWAPFLLAAAWLPAIGAFVAAKPNVGAAALGAHSGRRLAIALAGCAVLVAASWLVRPHWVGEWLANTHSAPHVRLPISFPGGFLLLLAALRWKRPEARLFLIFACTPHTPSLYDPLLLFFLCRTLRETLVLAVLTHLLFWGFVTWGSGATFDLYAANLGRFSTFIVYLPALAAILARPNSHAGDGAAAPDAAPRTGGYLPATRFDVTLLGVLVVASAMLVWLPLATYR